MRRARGASSAPAISVARPLGAEAGEQRMEEQRGHVPDRVAPGRVVQWRRDGVDAGRHTLGMGGDEHGLGRGLGGGERRRGAGLVRERDHEPAVGRGEAGLERVADVELCVGEGLAGDRVRGPGGVLAGAAAGEQDLLGAGDPRAPAAPVRRCPRSGRAGRPRRGSSPPSPTEGRCGVRARRSFAHLSWYPCTPCCPDLSVTVDERVFAAHPGYVAAVVVAEGLGNGPSDDDSSARLAEAEASLLARGLERAADDPHIAEWRAAFSRFGAKPKRYPCSAEALAARVIKGG